MTVGQLIKELKKFNPNMELFNSKKYPPNLGKKIVKDAGTSKITLNFALWTEKTSKKIQGYLLLLSATGLKK